MPRVMQWYLALAGGLALGFAAGDARALLAAGAFALAAFSAAFAGRRAAAAALAIAAAGAGLAWRADAADARCRAALVGGAPRRAAAVLVRLEHDVAPGGYARARVVRPCALDVSLGVDRGRAPAGAYVLVRGAAWPAGRGVRVPDAAIVGVGAPAALPALRARAGRTLDALFGRDAALARALVIADARAVDSAVRDRFADAGLVHALSVSGLHVAIVAGALALLLRAAQVPGAAVAPLTVAAVAAYVALIGAPAPAVRAGVMLGAAALAAALQRPTSPWAVFALGAAAPLVDPRAVTDLGYQLSVAGMAALVAGRHTAQTLAAYARSPTRVEAPWRRELRRAARGLRRGWRASLAGEAVVGVYAAAATAPLVAWHFGRVSLVGVAANLAAGPVLALLQPALFLALVLAPVPPAARLAADAARPLLRLLDAIAELAASAPGGIARASPSLLGAGLAGVGCAALLAAASTRRRRGTCAAVGAAALAAAAWADTLPGPAVLEVHAIDVGQGDAVALRTPRGRWVLFDAGRGGRGQDLGARVVVPYLRRRGGELAAVVLSHPHADHVGGAPSVIRRLRPRAVWDAGFALGSDTYRDVLTAARDAGARWHRVRPGDELAVDGVTLTVLAPDSAWTAALRDPNLASVVVRAQYGRVRVLLTGDAETSEEDWLRAHPPPAAGGAGRDPLQADVLKVAHHGSRTSTSPAFLARVRPAVALVSVGAGNTYGHPSPEVVRRLRSAGAEVRRTDALGSVVVRTDGHQLQLLDPDGQWRTPTTPPNPAPPR